jgi:tRNA A-37 threonylcarbamoyl transferase component Bud32
MPRHGLSGWQSCWPFLLRKGVVTCAPDRSSSCCPVFMEQVKDTLRATVRVSFDGRVYKTFRGPDAQERFANEVRVLRHLEKKKCNFVPRLLEANAEQLRIVTTNCGVRVEHLDQQRAAEIFAELEPYGVRHEDAEVRNITYRQTDGRFCVIDFEFSTILPGHEEPANASPK